jgi:hypothetical protein
MMRATASAPSNAWAPDACATVSAATTVALPATCDRRAMLLGKKVTKSDSLQRTAPKHPNPCQRSRIGPQDGSSPTPPHLTRPAPEPASPLADPDPTTAADLVAEAAPDLTLLAGHA